MASHDHLLHVADRRAGLGEEVHQSRGDAAVVRAGHRDQQRLGVRRRCLSASEGWVGCTTQRYRGPRVVQYIRRLPSTSGSPVMMDTAGPEVGQATRPTLALGSRLNGKVRAWIGSTS